MSFAAQAEGVEHLDCAAGDPVRLTDLQRTLATLDDARRDAGEGRELRGQQHPGRAGADDENVYGVGQGRRARLGAWGGRLYVGITRRVAVEVELHSLVLPLFIADHDAYGAAIVICGHPHRSSSLAIDQPKEIIQKRIPPLIPVNRLGEPEEIAAPWCFLPPTRRVAAVGAKRT